MSPDQCPEGVHLGTGIVADRGLKADEEWDLLPEVGQVREEKGRHRNRCPARRRRARAIEHDSLDACAAVIGERGVVSSEDRKSSCRHILRIGIKATK
jgi:hypothetical protein